MSQYQRFKAIVFAVTALFFVTGGWAGASGKRMDVAVVGAGPSGLVAADILRDLGYNVVVFEKESRVGGKVFTLETAGGLTELGAVLVTADDYPITLGYADEFGIPTIPLSRPTLILDEEGRKLTPEVFLKGRYSPQEIAEATANYAGVLARYADFIASPDMTNATPELAMPFKQFAKNNGIVPITELVRAIIVGFGYGYYESVPAAHYIKFMPFLVKPGPSGPVTSEGRVFPSGFQSLFEALANTLDVHLNSKVISIDRKLNGVLVTVYDTEKQETEELKFDAVVISAPLNKVPDFLDATRKEKWLFRKIRSNRFFVTLFTAQGLVSEDNLDTGESLYFIENASPKGINHVVVWALASSPNNSNIGNAYQIAQKLISPDQVTAILVDDVAEQGGAFGSGLFRQEWSNYFPHVSPKLIRLGYFNAVDKLQGKGNVYYVGSTLAGFETVEHAARQAKALILEHFSNQ